MEKLTGNEVKARINLINDQMEEIITCNKFILNSGVVALTEQINRLQEVCPHEFEHGHCIFCGAKQKDE